MSNYRLLFTSWKHRRRLNHLEKEIYRPLGARKKNKMKKYLLLVSVLFVSASKCVEPGRVIRVLEVSKPKITQTPTQGLKSECNNWKISKADIEKYFRNAHTIRGIEKQYYYDFYGCGVEGKVQINDSIFKFELDAGGTSVLLHKTGSQKYLGNDTNHQETALWAGRFTEKELEE